MATPQPIIPAQQDFTFQRGSAGAYALIAAQVKNPDGSLVDLTGATASITTWVNGRNLPAVAGPLAVDVPSATVSWSPSLAQLDMLPLGRVTQYAVTIAFPGGSQGPYLEGFLIGEPAGGSGGSSQVTATIILQGPQGPQGRPGDEATTSIFPVSSPSTLWTLAHGLDRYPSVTIVDTAGDLCGADVSYVDANTIAVSFGSATAGTAYLN